MGYRLTRQAEQDLIDIYLTGASDFGVPQAERYADGFGRSFAFLAEYPRAARERVETRPRVRIHPYRSHLIVYITEGEDILIVRIRHGREDWVNDD